LDHESLGLATRQVGTPRGVALMATFVPHTEADIVAMLDFLGLESPEQLFSVVPEAIRLATPLALGPPVSEADLVDLLEERGAANRPIGRGSDLICFAGGGAYDHEIPAVTRALAGRSEFVTAYTPYQAEVAQGVLQALFEYQTMVARLAGLEIANASLYDGAASLVEAANLAVAATSNARVVCSTGVHPHWREVMATFARGTGHSIESVPLLDGRTDWSRVTTDGGAGAVVVASPNFLGCIEQVGEARQLADELGARLIVAFDPIATGLLRSPGELGADIAIAEGQSLGTTLGFGGPYLGLFACRSEDLRRLPGRLVGETLDTEGRRAYVTTLRSREQDIRREKASSNVCTNQTLMAITAAIQLGWLGTDGLREVALRSARGTRYTRERALEIEGITAASSCPVVREFALKLPVPAQEVIDTMLDDGYLAGVAIGEGYEGTDYEGALLVAVTERRTRAEIDGYLAALEKAVHR
jgi:glycine dehydrogenase subunit 1